MLVVVDTNVWVSALLNPRGSPARLLRAFVEGEFTPAVSRELIEELANVLSRPRVWRTLARRLSRYDVQFALSILANFQLIATTLLYTLGQAGHWVDLQGDIDLCRDSRDNMFLETAIRSKAQYLITRDDDLKRDSALIAQMENHGIQVVSVQRFLEILEGNADS
jgi:putative PIN family toxin of toxin-antitoxin system